MSFLTHFIISFITILIVSTIMSRIYKDVEKKDRGFVLNYHKLTYRRRLIRSLWGIPIISLLYFIIYLLDDLQSIEYTIIGIIFFSTVFLDIAYNYMKWKKNENNSGERQ